ncbi:hypothetical protein BD626DRAFT_575769 [Schizophyllum amplum]|uniref:Uncharacterized protein n=1 Tax=Schizophyllum amplum TaxID=97359 RepID=A0A550BV19_9AGAR|nr:hypothetical protein BD626DRAFT_575769 [Auriculariopsis ampla]
MEGVARLPVRDATLPARNASPTTALPHPQRVVPTDPSLLPQDTLPSSPPPSSPPARYSSPFSNDLDENDQGTFGMSSDPLRSPSPLPQDADLAVAPDAPECEGALVDWSAGPLLSTYPFPRHEGSTLGWVPIEIEHTNDTAVQAGAAAASDRRSLRVRSKDCNGKLTAKHAGNACWHCVKVPNSSEFRRLLRGATKAKKHTPYEYLSHSQLLALVRKLARELRKLRLKARNAESRLETAQRHLKDYERIVMLLSTNDVPGLRRLLAVSLRNRKSARAITEQLLLAIDGLYTVRSGATSRDYDKAFLAKALGGPRLLYALMKAEGYVSQHTLARRRRLPQLQVSVGVPSRSHISDNITALFHPDVRPPPSRPIGVVLLIDGIALEETCRLDLERGLVVGLCREHTGDLDITVDSGQNPGQ